MSSRRRHARSPALTPLEDDDLLCEILLRLPPEPSSLPRASAVCKRWSRLVSDAAFFRRFRLRHRRNPPLLGFFDRFKSISFLPTLEAPNRVPPGRFSLELGDEFDLSISLGCRHGLFLVFLSKPHQVLVWDPITGDKHHIAVPSAFDTDKIHGLVHGAVLRPAGEGQHFQVVLEGADYKQQAIACVYSSETGLWGNIISTPLPLPYEDDWMFPIVYTVMAGDSLYWQVAGICGILEFDMVKQSLAVIEVPMDMSGEDKSWTIIRAEGGGLGLLFVSDSDCTAQLWKRKTDCDGIVSWRLAKTIELDKLLSLKPEEKGLLVILGFAEENNVVFLWTVIGVHMINLDSLKFKKLFKTNHFTHYHPFESVYTAETNAGGGHDGAELLLNA